MGMKEPKRSSGTIGNVVNQAKETGKHAPIPNTATSAKEVEAKRITNTIGHK